MKLKQYPKQALALAQKLWAKEPARVISVTVAVIVFVAARLGVVLPHESVVSAVGFALPLLLGGELIRSQVTPVASQAPSPKTGAVPPAIPQA